MSNVVNRNRHLQYEYPQIPRRLVYDKSLSHDAKYVYIFMACKPEGWEFYQEAMAKEIGMSLGTLKKYIGELVASGWITKGRQQNAGGKFGAVEYVIETSPKKKAEKAAVGQNLTDGQKTVDAKLTCRNIISNNIIYNTLDLNTPSTGARDYLSEEQGELWRDQSWQEVICMKHHITLDRCRDLIADFILNCRCDGMEQHMSLADLKSHFNNWLKFNKDGGKDNRAGRTDRPSPEENRNYVERWALEQTRNCLEHTAEGGGGGVQEVLPF